MRHFGARKRSSAVGLEDSEKSGWNEDIELVVHDWSVDVLAEDWSGVSEWQQLMGMAERHPGALVLSGEGNYRLADAARLVVGLSVRCALQAVLANRAISQLGNSALLEKRGFWPASDKVYERVASPLHRAVLKMLEFVSWFSVEDEDSLEQLLRACLREVNELDKISANAAGEKAQDCLRRKRGTEALLIEPIKSQPRGAAAGSPPAMTDRHL